MNSLPSAVTKSLTFIPLAGAVFFFDLPSAAAGVLVPKVLALLLSAAVVILAGSWVKKRILAASLELSTPNFGLGTVLLVAFAGVYVWGSYSASPGIVHFLSFFLLLASYTAYRMGTRILMKAAPLFPIAALSFPASVSPTPLAPVLFLVQAVLALLLYLGPRFRSFLMLSSVLCMGLIGWLFPVLEVGALDMPTWLLVPLPLLLAITPRFGHLQSTPGEAQPPACDKHEVGPSGYCFVCGRRVSKPSAGEAVGGWGLVAVAGVVALLLLADLPALTFAAAPYDSHFLARGSSAAVTPVTPAGWQVNSTVYSNFTRSQPYAVEQVYVPLQHPEVKNYTVFYAVALTNPSTGAPGGEVPGWGIVWNNFTKLGPLEGYLTAYRSASGTMMVYSGHTTMAFVRNSTFQNFDVGVSFVRTYKDQNVAADSLGFLGDLNSVWVPTLQLDQSYSGWTSFLRSTYTGAVFVLPFMLILATALLMAWVAYRARKADRELDGRLRRAFTLDTAQWNDAALLLAATEFYGGSNGLLRGSEAIDHPFDIVTTLRTAGLAKPIFAEAGDSLVLKWKAGF